MKTRVCKQYNYARGEYDLVLEAFNDKPLQSNTWYEVLAYPGSMQETALHDAEVMAKTSRPPQTIIREFDL